MMEMSSKVYIQFAEDISDYLEAEWREQKTPIGTERTFILTKQGIVYSLNLDTQQCTQQDVSKIMKGLTQGSDPQQFAEEMRKQMGLKEQGSCEGAGLTGTKYVSQLGSLCLYKDAFLLWQEMMGSNTRVTKVQFDKALPRDKIQLPKNVNCIQDPSLEEALGNIPAYPGIQAQEAEPSSTSGESVDQSAPVTEEEMQQMKDMMKKLGDMFKQPSQ